MYMLKIVASYLALKHRPYNAPLLLLIVLKTGKSKLGVTAHGNGCLKGEERFHSTRHPFTKPRTTLSSSSSAWQTTHNQKKGTSTVSTWTDLWQGLTSSPENSMSKAAKALSKMTFWMCGNSCSNVSSVTSTTSTHSVMMRMNRN